MNKLFFSLLLLGTVHSSMAQKYWNNWYFGDKLGISFNSNPPTVLTDSKLRRNFGPACISDSATGNLLFTADEGVVFDRNFDRMPGKIYVNDPLNHYIVPVPGDKDRYYIFVTNRNNIYYVQVNMSLRNGLGDVEGNTNLLLGPDAIHYLTVVKRLNDDGYWIITHSAGSNEFKAFSVTASGISLPVISHVGSTPLVLLASYYGPNTLFSNSAGSEIIHCSGNGTASAKTEQFHFNKACGTLTYIRSFTPDSSPMTFSHGAFCANDRYLYLSWYYTYDKKVNSSVFQYDMEAAEPDLSRKRLSAPAGIVFSRISLAPDGLIYMTTSNPAGVGSNNQALDISYIRDAEKPSAFIAFNVFDPFRGNDSRAIIAWPSFILDRSINYGKPELVISEGCVNDAIRFDLKSTFLFDSVKWDLGEGTVSQLEKFSHQYLVPGDYTVSFTGYVCGNKLSASKKIRIIDFPFFNLGADTILCSGQQYILKGPVADTYQWSDGSITKEIRISTAGTYVLRAGSYGCYRTDTVSLSYRQPVLVELGVDQFLCEEYKDLVKLDAGKRFQTYKWIPTGDSTQWIMVEKTGDYYVIVNDFHGCAGNDGITIKSNCPVYILFPNAFTPNDDGLNDVFAPTYIDAISYHLEIYDRWGERVFTSENPSEGWDGSFGGKQVPQGLYFYRVEYSGFRDKIFRKSHDTQVVHLIR